MQKKRKTLGMGKLSRKTEYPACSGFFYDVLEKLTSDRKNIVLAVLSGLLLTGSFPKIEIDWLSWFALVPLLYALKELSPKGSFRIGFIAGLVHFLSLLYWLVPVMRTYGYLPWYLSISILFLFSAALALFIALFSMILTALGKKPIRCLAIMPPVWVSLEYIRTFIFSGFPWELLGYSQFGRLQLIQISDIFGVYGVSFLIALSNASIFITLLYFTKRRWQNSEISRYLAALSLIGLAIGVGLTWAYGLWRLNSIDQLIAASPKAQITVVQGNIEQLVKWDPAFQVATVKKYNRLSLSAKPDNPDLVIWPESATPFYFLYEIKPSELVMEGIRRVNTDFIIGSPSFVRKNNNVEYYVSAYLVSPQNKAISRYDKTHLVPYGEYVPFKKWLPFLGKIVAQVGDFVPGKRGKTIAWRDDGLGIQICYEIIFPELSRAMAKNNATLLINITNDAWFGKTSGPYQHFSMTVFRAVENRRALARSANTGISGFIDPAGRILASTPLLKEATVTRSVPLIEEKTIYTRFGDVFALACLTVSLFVILIKFGKYAFGLTINR
jgi:apolipoprotein N-acyltransferase